VIFRRRDREQYEGWWEPVPGSSSPDLHGKVEWEPSRDGGTEIDLLVKRLDLPDGAEVDVVCEGVVVLRTTVTNRSVRRILKSADGHAVPALAGKGVELQHRGTPLARTVLEPD
jgi:hypothetical protein